MFFETNGKLLTMGELRAELQQQAQREGVDLPTFCERLEAERVAKSTIAKERMPYLRSLAERLTREGLGRGALGQPLMNEGLDPFTAAETVFSARLAYRANPLSQGISGDATPGLVH